MAARGRTIAVVGGLVRIFGRFAAAALPWAFGALAAVPLAGHAAPLPADLLVAAVPNRPLRVQKLCDFAAEASRLQGLPVNDDPVFRRPSDAKKAELGRIRKAIIAGGDGDRDLAALLAGSEGASLARLALNDRDRRVQLAAVRGAVPLAQDHPRLYAFLPTLDANTEKNLALAMLDLDFATRCDTPILFALDALAHPDPEVVARAADKLLQLAGTMRDTGPVDRLADWLARPARLSWLRVRVARRLGAMGFLHLAPRWTALQKDPDAAVAAEALVARALLAPEELAPLAEPLLRDRKPDRQILGLRLALLTHADRQSDLLALVQGLAQSRAQWRDLATREAVAVAAVAKAVLGRWSLRPVE